METVGADHQIEPARWAMLELDACTVTAVLDLGDGVAEDDFALVFDGAVNHLTEIAARQADVSAAGHPAQEVDIEASDPPPAIVDKSQLRDVITPTLQFREQSDLFGDVVAESPEINEVPAGAQAWRARSASA
jgi:hypothetical protein